MADNTPPVLLAGDLRKRIAAAGGAWKVDPALRDDQPVPVRATGGQPPRLLAKDVARIDFAALKRTFPPNDLRVLQPKSAPPPPLPGAPAPSAQPIARRPLPHAPAPAPVPGHPKPANPEPSTIFDAVDWRARWGMPWLTKVRDQSVCGTCWAFAATALVETMTRIEHCVWAPRSEGDTLLSANANCNNGGDIPLGLNAIVAKGLVDAASMPFVPAVTNYVAAPDRAGRTTRIANYVPVGHIDDQKRWLLEVGPLGTGFYVWADFEQYPHNGQAVYHVDQTQIGYVDAQHINDERGWHAMLIVGFNDSLGAWIVRNQWGPGWGYGGYAYIGYGETEIDTGAKWGVTLTDCDPWAKRRLHNGCLLEGDQGQRHTDLEIVASAGSHLRHWRRINGTWTAQGDFAAGLSPTTPALIQSTYLRNHELVHRAAADGRLHHWWRESFSGTWKDGGAFGPADVAGEPGLMQSNYNTPGNLEVVVRTKAGQLVHVGRSGGQWIETARFAGNVKHSGPSLIQSATGFKGNFDMVCVLNDGTMQHWRRFNDIYEGWGLVDHFGAGIDSPPCMIESQFDSADETQPGNFELCVAAGGQFQHWWRDNGAKPQWRAGGRYGQNIAQVAGLCQSASGFNLELIAILTDQRIQHWWRQGGVWYPGPIIGKLTG